jgi:glycosyltransferase involved in cell wall biosynthesis
LLGAKCIDHFHLATGLLSLTATIFINGKFFDQPTTGAQRFAVEVVVALDIFLAGSAEFEGHEFSLLVTKGVIRNLPIFKRIRLVELGGFRSHLWEQITLPLFVRGSFLINLSGSAPLFKRKQLFTIFDGAIFDFPQAYSRLFLAWYCLLYRVQSRFAFGLVTLSMYSRDRLCKHLGITPDRFAILPCGVDHIYKINPDESVLRKLDLRPGGYLLAVGSANPSKNFKGLIQAFTSLKSGHGVVLVVVGGSNSAVFAGDDESVGANVVRTGRVNDGELAALYSHARAFVFPSLYEGFGIPPLEAMACGCPVIASNATSIPEVCGNAVGYFDPSSISSIRDSLEKVITDASWRSTLQIAGRHKATEYMWEEAARQLIRYLKKIGAISD